MSDEKRYEIFEYLLKKLEMHNIDELCQYNQYFIKRFFEFALNQPLYVKNSIENKSLSISSCYVDKTKLSNAVWRENIERCLMVACIISVTQNIEMYQ